MRIFDDSDVNAGTQVPVPNVPSHLSPPHQSATGSRMRVSTRGESEVPNEQRV